MNRSERVVLRLAVLLGGAMLMAMEVAAFRIIGKTFGSALRETTAVIAVFLASMSLGYWLGGLAGDRWPRAQTLAWALLAAAATLLAVPWLDAILSARVAASALDLSTHAFLVTTVLFAIPAVLFAAISPIAVRLFASDSAVSGSTAGSISAISTVGSIAGTILTAFFLLDWLASIMRMVLCISATAGLTAAAVVLFATARSRTESERSHTRRSAIAVVVGVLAVVIPAASFVSSTRLDRSLLAPVAGWKIVYVADSPYHRITVRDQGGRFRYLSFNLATQSRMALADPFGPGHPYVEAFHLAPLLRPGIRRVLMIGLGGGTGVKQFLHTYPNVTIDAVELDPMVVAVARRYFALPTDPRLRVHVGDGRTFLDRSTERWDLIVIDAYTTNRYGDALPPHLATREFFQRVSSHLNEGGIAYFHCTWASTKLVPALHKTVGSVFRSVLASGGEMLASDVPLILADRGTLLARVRTPPLARYPDLGRYLAELEPRDRFADDVPVLTDDYAPVDQLMSRH
jgi:spermidine synthase